MSEMPRRMQTVAGQDEAERDLRQALNRAVLEAVSAGISIERVVSALSVVLDRERRLLNEQRANERSY